MINLTDHLANFNLHDFDSLNAGFKNGLVRDKKQIQQANQYWIKVRHEYGLAGSPNLLTPPDANLKLDKSTRPTYGLTLQHYVQKLSNGKVINACPYAGDCTKVCVLDNGNGYYPRVQLARRARTEFLYRYPYRFGVLLAYSLSLAVKKNGPILFRPNVNSDLQWETVLPALTSGEAFGSNIISYGYSKLPGTLDHKGGWIDKAYRVAYSWNEKTDRPKALKFLKNGGNIAIVTDRKPKELVTQWSKAAKVIDADLTDEWIIDADGVWGDLSAKGKARALIGTSDFVTIRPKEVAHAS